VWQIDAGNAGNPSHSGNDGQTFLNIIVGTKKVIFEVWKGRSGDFELVDSWSVSVKNKKSLSTI